jgi:uncharacterized membrane protein
MRRRRDREQGVVAVVMALVICLVLVPLAALAVDIGQQRVARRDAQAIADVVALDMARQLGLGVTPTDTMATTSADRSAGAIGHDAAVHVYTGYIPSGATFVSDQSLGCGSTSPYNSYFTEPSAQNPANAVLVTASRTADFAIMGGSGPVCRSAIAGNDATTCFKLGSYAAAINSAGSSVLAPLNDIFGLNLQLLSYQGLANAKVRLADIAADPHIGGTDALLGGGVSVANLVRATTDVLNAQNPVNTVAVSALGSVLTIATTLPNIDFGKVIKIDPNDKAALNTEFSVLDLLAGAVLVADGNHAVSIPNLWANVAGTGNTKISDLSIIQNPSIACGTPNSQEAQADQAQLKGTVTFDQMNVPSINIGIANLKTGVAGAVLNVNLATAHGALVSPPQVQCKSGTLADPDTYTVNVSSSLATVSLSTQLPITGNVSILGLGLVSLNLVVDVNVSNQVAANSTPANLKVPPNDTTPISTGSPVRLNMASVNVSIDPSSTAKVLGLDVLNSLLLAPTLNAVLGAVLNGNTSFVGKTITPLVANINDLLTGPLATLLGLDVGGADVYAVGRPQCAVPGLKG